LKSESQTLWPAPLPAGGRTIDLDAWFDVINPTEGSKWSLDDATGLSDTGWVTGYGVHADGVREYRRAYLLDASGLIPEPGSLWLAATVSLRLLGRRR
jgi:hypothetical protein